MSRVRCILLLIAAAVAAGALSSCSLKKNTAATRRYQGFITRYNIHYNGQTHYDETLKKMESGYADDFTRLLPMHPAEAHADPKAPQPEGSFTRSIEKAQKAIQLRSIKKRPRRQPGHGNDPAYREWLRREEYNPFLHNSWMLMARSQYMNGDFLPAAATFHYIATHFTWLPATVAEARLWQARSYCAAGWLNEAQATMERVREKNLTSRHLIALRAFVQADILIRRGLYAEAVEPLELAIADSHGAQRTRLTFLLGQVCARAGMTDRARQAFRKAGGSVSAPYRTRFNARIALSATLTGGATSAEIAKELKALRRMQRYDRNADYLDQIFYAEGNLLMAQRDTAAAMHAYAEAAARSQRRGMDMALAQLALGTLYFDRGDYDHAQPCYAEALPLLPDDYPDRARLAARSDVLDDLARHSRAVALNDSLLRLADMPEAARLAVVDSIIHALTEREKEEERQRQREELDAKAEERAAATGTENPGGAANAPAQFTMNTDKSWYFYNPTTRSAGSAQFRRQWGNRKLEDDWRRRNRNSYAPLTSDADTDSDATPTDSTATDGAGATADGSAKKATPAADDPHSREYYLKDIPADSASRATAHEAIQDGLYNMGLILKDRLEDYPAADRQWQRLLREYPDNVYRLDVYHNLYLMAARRGDTTLAEHYRRLVASEFPDSPEGQAMADPRYLDNLREMHARQEELYSRTWDAYLADNNDSVRSAAAYAAEHYPMSPIMPKFMFLEALTHVSGGDSDGFTDALRKLVERYPDADVSSLAATWLRSAAEGRAIVTEGSNARGLLYSTRLTDSAQQGDAAAAAADTIAVTLEPDAPRIVLVTFPADTVQANEMLYEVARYNFNSFSVADFDLEQLRFGSLGIILVRTFPNLADADEYARRLTDALPLPPGVQAIVIAEADWRELLSRGLSLEQYFRALTDAADARVHSSVLPPEEYPDAAEMYGEPQEDAPEEE